MPLSETINRGLPRPPMSAVSSRAGHVIHDVEDAEAPAEGELIVDEVERPARVDLRLARPHSPSPRAAFAHRQPFLPIEPIDAVDARWFALVT